MSEVAAERRTAIMCAESVRWRCRRLMIADYLLCARWSVNYLMGADRATPAKLASGAIQAEDALLYPALNAG